MLGLRPPRIGRRTVTGAIPVAGAWRRWGHVVVVGRPIVGEV
ncbi:hypothetical protein I552_7918 [Mycobacterium xenopi 3993]|nr:hypothetical protein I552_7918 [Mycobacterium xenopi 3993]